MASKQSEVLKFITTTKDLKFDIIGSTVTKGGYVVYHIRILRVDSDHTVTKSGYIIFRRFNDFKYLQHELAGTTSNPGVHALAYDEIKTRFPLPPDTFFRRTSVDFRQHRSRALEDCLIRMFKEPSLRSSRAMRVFLTENAKKIGTDYEEEDPKNKNKKSPLFEDVSLVLEFFDDLEADAALSPTQRKQKRQQQKQITDVAAEAGGSAADTAADGSGGGGVPPPVRIGDDSNQQSPSSSGHSPNEKGKNTTVSSLPTPPARHSSSSGNPPDEVNQLKRDADKQANSEAPHEVDETTTKAPLSKEEELAHHAALLLGCSRDHLHLVEIVLMEGGATGKTFFMSLGAGAAVPYPPILTRGDDKSVGDENDQKDQKNLKDVCVRKLDANEAETLQKVSQVFANAELSPKLITSSDQCLISELVDAKPVSVNNLGSFASTNERNKGEAEGGDSAQIGSDVSLVADLVSRLHRLPKEATGVAPRNELEFWLNKALLSLPDLNDKVKKTLKEQVDQVGSLITAPGLKGTAGRMCTTHGDLHPGNILVQPTAAAAAANATPGSSEDTSAQRAWLVDLEHVGPRRAGFDIAYFFAVWGDLTYQLNFVPSPENPMPYPNYLARRTFVETYLKGLGVNNIEKGESIKDFMLQIEIAGVCERLRLMLIWIIIAQGNVNHMMVGAVSMFLPHIEKSLKLIDELNGLLPRSDEYSELRMEIITRGLLVVAATREAKLKAEEEAKLKTEEEAKLKAEEEAKLKAEDEANLKAEEEAKLKADEEAKLKAEEEAKLKTEAAGEVSASSPENEKPIAVSDNKSAEVETNKKEDVEEEGEKDANNVRGSEDSTGSAGSEDSKGNKSKPRRRSSESMKNWETMRLEAENLKKQEIEAAKQARINEATSQRQERMEVLNVELSEEEKRKADEEAQRVADLLAAKLESKEKLKEKKSLEKTQFETSLDSKTAGGKKGRRDGSVHISDDLKGTRAGIMKNKEAEWKKRLSSRDDDEIDSAMNNASNADNDSFSPMGSKSADSIDSFPVPATNDKKLPGKLNLTEKEKEEQALLVSNREAKRRDGSVYIDEKINGTRAVTMKNKEAEWKKKISGSSSGEVDEANDLKAPTTSLQDTIENAKKEAEEEEARLLAEEAAAAAKLKAEEEEAAAAKLKAEEEVAAAAKLKAEEEEAAAAAKLKAEEEAAAAKLKAEEEEAAAAKFKAEEEEASAAKLKAEEEAEAAGKLKAEEEEAAAEQAALDNDTRETRRRDGSVFISEKVKGTRAGIMKNKEAEWKKKLSTDDNETEEDDKAGETEGNSMEDNINKAKKQIELEEQVEAEARKAGEVGEAAVNTDAIQEKETDEEIVEERRLSAAEIEEIETRERKASLTRKTARKSALASKEQAAHAARHHATLDAATAKLALTNPALAAKIAAQAENAPVRRRSSGSRSRSGSGEATLQAIKQAQEAQLQAQSELSPNKEEDEEVEKRETQLSEAEVNTEVNNSTKGPTEPPAAEAASSLTNDTNIDKVVVKDEAVDEGTGQTEAIGAEAVEEGAAGAEVEEVEPSSAPEGKKKKGRRMSLKKMGSWMSKSSSMKEKEKK